MTSSYDVSEIIRRLHLEPHPEGGHYRRTWQHPEMADGRPLTSSIVYLLARGDRSHWHRVDAFEQWHHYAGDPLELKLSEDRVNTTAVILGDNVFKGMFPQHTVPAGTWQSAVTLGDFTLVGCTVTPGFDFEGFELAPRGWEPGD